MAIRYQETDLSTDPPSYQMADTDRRTFSFSLPAESAATLASAELTFARTYPEPYEVIEGVASEAVAPTGKTVVVLVDMRELTQRNVTYELEVVLVGSDGNTETMTLAIPCVA